MQKTDTKPFNSFCRKKAEENLAKVHSYVTINSGYSEAFKFEVQERGDNDWRIVVFQKEQGESRGNYVDVADDFLIEALEH